MWAEVWRRQEWESIIKSVLFIPTMLGNPFLILSLIIIYHLSNTPKQDLYSSGIRLQENVPKTQVWTTHLSLFLWGYTTCLGVVTFWRRRLAQHKKDATFVICFLDVKCYTLSHEVTIMCEHWKTKTRASIPMSLSFSLVYLVHYNSPRKRWCLFIPSWLGNEIHGRRAQIWVGQSQADCMNVVWGNWLQLHTSPAPHISLFIIP
jgi:hypothetical protein